MRYVAAYLLSALGNKEPNAADIEKILSSVGIESDSEKLKTVISELNGKNIEELVAKGQEKLATMPSGGGVAAVAVAPAASGGAGATVADSSANNEEKETKKEEQEESDDDMGFGLFD